MQYLPVNLIQGSLMHGFDGNTIQKTLKPVRFFSNNMPRNFCWKFYQLCVVCFCQLFIIRHDCTLLIFVICWSSQCNAIGIAVFTSYLNSRLINRWRLLCPKLSLFGISAIYIQISLTVSQSLFWYL